MTARWWIVSTVDSRGRVWSTSILAGSSWHAASLVSGRVVSVVDGGAA